MTTNAYRPSGKVRLLPGALAVGSVVLLAFAYSCRAPWWVASAGFAALYSVVRARRPGVAAALGLAIGAIASSVALYWLPHGLARASGCSALMALAATALAAAAYALRFGVAAWSASRAAANRWPPALGFFLGYVSAEMAAAGPLPFYFGASAHGTPTLLQVADLAGPIAVSSVLVAAGLAVAELGAAVRQTGASRSRCVERALPWGVFVAIAVLYGHFRLADASPVATHDPHAVRIGIPQTGAPSEPTRSQAATAQAVRTLVLATQDLHERGANAVIWGESTVSFPVPLADIPKLYPHLFTMALGAPTLLGALLPSSRPDRFYNSAVAIGAGGEVDGIYAKRRLAPLSENIPGRDRSPMLAGLFPAAREVPGPTRQIALRLLGHPISAFICFESLLPDLVRQSVTADSSELIVAMANDAWFGDTWEPWMHFASAKLRAVENRRYLVRAAGSGISGFVDPWGVAHEVTTPTSQALLLGLVAWRATPTTYQRAGDVPWVAAGIAAIYIVLRTRRSKQ